MVEELVGARMAAAARRLADLDPDALGIPDTELPEGAR